MNKEQFVISLNNLKIEATEQMLQQLEKYCEMLINENKLYNLTAITDKENIYLKHFYDSLTLVKIIDLNSQSICDMGTGAGFPGIVLKIFFPNLKVTLLDSTLKKCAFLNKVIQSLALSQITVVNERAEIYSQRVREKYDLVVSRAMAPLKHLLEYGVPLLKVNGYFLSMKGNIDKEIIDIESYLTKLHLSSIETINFLLPYETSNRTLIKIRKEKKTDLLYPRKYTEIKKEKI